MALGEFDLIRRFFAKPPRNSAIALAIGDDCAIVRPEYGRDWAVTVDTLVEGVHFFPGTDPEKLGHKALAVNLSDLAAMGAQPQFVTLALTVPQADEQWLAAFAKGFFALADQFGVELIGGDTTRGPLAITIQAMGSIAPERAMRRSDAKAGDGIFVTGSLGLAGLALKALLGTPAIADATALAQLETPQPRVAAGLALAGLANACIDISDGLLADLGHILQSSQVGACLQWEAMPFSASVRNYIAATDDWLMPLSTGDDYELCFTVAAERQAAVAEAMAPLDCKITRIGHIEEQPGLRLDRLGAILPLHIDGYQHFNAGP